MFDNNPPMYKCNWLQIKQLCLHSVLSHEGSSVIKTLQGIVHFPSLEKNHFETEPRNIPLATTLNVAILRQIRRKNIKIYWIHSNGPEGPRLGRPGPGMIIFLCRHSMRFLRSASSPPGRPRE